MKTKLQIDVDILLELILSRQDNLLHQKLILCKSFQQHRGCKQPLSELSRTHKQIAAFFSEIEEHRNNHQESIFKRYENVDIQSYLKPILFRFISKVQRHVKYFSNKLHSVLNCVYESVIGQALEHQLELRQFALEKINKEVKLGVFLREFQAVINHRYRRELNKFVSFYQTYGYLIDKRAEKPAIYALKQEKYRMLTTQKSVEFSVKCFYYFLNTLNHSHTKTFQSSIKGIKSLDIDDNSSVLVSSIHQSIREDGFCEVYISKMEKMTKELFLRNSEIQKMLPKGKEREQCIGQPQSRASSKVQRESFNSRRSVCESVNRNLRSSNIENYQKEKEKEKQKEKEKPNERRSVLRQTLVEIVLGDKQIHAKYAEPHTSDIFLPSIKDKHLKNQAGNLYRRIYVLKESS